MQPLEPARGTVAGDTPPAPLRPPLPPWVWLGLSSLAYFAAQALAFQFPDSFGLVAAIWPAAGIALASLLLSPKRLWPALLACLFAVGLAANLTTQRPLLASVGFMVANIAETSASAWLITRWCGHRVRFTQVREVLALTFATVLINAATALIGAGAASFVIGAQFWAFYATWWVSDGLGLLLITPLLVIWATSWRALANENRLRLFETAALLTLGCAVAWFAFGRKGTGEYPEPHPYLLSVFAIWAAFRTGHQSLVTLLGAFSLLAIGCTAAGLGSFHLGGLDTAHRLLSVQLFLGVLGVTALLMAASVTQQREAQALLHAVVEGTSDAIYVKDRQGRYLLFNSAAARYVGKTPAEVLGKDDRFLFPPKEAAAVMLGDQRCLTAGAPCTYEERVTSATGQAMVFLSTKGPLRNETGAVVGLFGIAREITERHRSEAQRAALAELIERKNQELESLVYVTSHDLRSPLLNIQGFSERLRQAGNDLARAATTPEWDNALRHQVAELGTVRIPQALGFIQTSAEKMSHLIDGLLRLSRLGRATMQPERLDLNRLLAEVRSGLAHQIETAGAAVDVGPLPPYTGDPTLFNQLFTNLLDNAVKYRSPERPLQVHITGRIERADTVYEVADNGVGIPQAHLERIWELFHRVDPTGPVPGEGLGLSLVRRIVERHRGQIHVESTPGVGTRFIIRLPPLDTASNRDL